MEWDYLKGRYIDSAGNEFKTLPETSTTTPAATTTSSGTSSDNKVDYTNFITNNYNDLFGRDPEAEALNYWNDDLNNGTPTAGFSQTLINGASSDDYNYYKNRDQTKIFNEDISGKQVGSYSGLGDHGKKLLDSLIPKLISSVEGWRSDIDKSTRSASDLYRSMSKEAMKTQAQSILDDLASRNIFSGKVAENAMAKGMSEIAKGYADSGMESAMVGASMKAQEPTMIGNIVGLGKSSESFNELAPYELLMNSYLNMQ